MASLSGRAIKNTIVANPTSSNANPTIKTVTPVSGQNFEAVIQPSKKGSAVVT